MAQPSVLSYVLAVIVLTGAAVITPDTVLCVAADHYHLELVVGASCNNFVPGLTGPHSPGSQPKDGCPKGSKDFRLVVDSQRADNTRAIVAPAAIMLVATGCRGGLERFILTSEIAALNSFLSRGIPASSSVANLTNLLA